MQDTKTDRAQTLFAGMWKWRSESELTIRIVLEITYALMNIVQRGRLSEESELAFLAHLVVMTKEGQENFTWELLEASSVSQAACTRERASLTPNKVVW